MVPSCGPENIYKRAHEQNLTLLSVNIRFELNFFVTFSLYKRKVPFYFSTKYISSHGSQIFDSTIPFWIALLAAISIIVLARPHLNAPHHAYT